MNREVKRKKPKNLWKSLKYSWAGITYTFKSEYSYRLELFFIALGIILAFVVGVTPTQGAILAGMMTLVLVLEMINTIIERMMDIMKPQIHPFAKHMKDISAGTVLLSIIGSIIVSVLIFFPYFT